LLKKAAAERDRKYDLEVEKLNAKRPKESLVDLHTKKQKKDQDEKEEQGAKSERRPFDREKDMKIITFKSDKERKGTLDKAKLLDTRFGHSSNQKYL